MTKPPPTAEALYKPHRKHPILFEGTFLEEWLHPDFVNLLQCIQEAEQEQLSFSPTDVTRVISTSSAENSNSNVDDHRHDDAQDEPMAKKFRSLEPDSDTKNGMNGTFPSNIMNEDEDDKHNNNDKSKDSAADALTKTAQRITERLVETGWLRVELPGAVYSFRSFTDDFIRLFNEEIQHFYHCSTVYRIPSRRPNSMNQYGISINTLGLQSLMTSLQKRYLQPLSRVLFPLEGSQLDDHHSFIIRYQQGEDLGLDMHVDDAEVTFNVCMGDDFSGAALSFCGMFGSPIHRKQTLQYHHEVGRAVLHLGAQRHGADDIESGCRSNLIVWSRNYAYRQHAEAFIERRGRYYHSEEGPPDAVCLSFTHDRDFPAYRELPRQAIRLLDTHHYGPWCPPESKEYPGFDQAARLAEERIRLFEQGKLDQQHQVVEEEPYKSAAAAAAAASKGDAVKQQPQPQEQRCD